MCRGMAKKFSHNHVLLENLQQIHKKEKKNVTTNTHTYKRKQVWEMGWGREVEI